MKKNLLIVLCLMTITGCTQKSEKLLLSGSGWNKIVIIDKATQVIEWEYPAEKGWECNSVAATPDGNILFSYSKGAKLVNIKKEELWKIDAPENCDLQSASVLPNGNYLIAWGGVPATVLEVNPQGKTVSKTEFTLDIDRAHHFFRQIIKNKKGNFVVPVYGLGELLEISPEGQILRQINVGGTPFSVVELDNGNYLVAGGDGHQYKELNFETGEIVKITDAEDIEGVKLSFVAQLLPARDGGLYVCNWQGHNRNRESENYPQLIEIDSTGKIVWQINDKVNFGMISAICPIEIK
jgi:outer membrane protein assembly factor BamB